MPRSTQIINGFRRLDRKSGYRPINPVHHKQDKKKLSYVRSNSSFTCSDSSRRYNVLIILPATCFALSIILLLCDSLLH